MRNLKQRFELAAVLGQGGCGKVFRATDRETGREVALKILNAQARDEPKLFQRFVREARALARIEHPHVTGVVGSDFESETAWIALEYVAGENLEQRLRRGGALPLTEARALGRQLAEAVGELHRHGIIHRDLKPANLMLREGDGSLAVTDLGLAALADATVVTETGEVFGTPLYLPPEAVRGQPWTTQGDLYQVGAIFFEVLTGTRLVAANGMADALAAVLEGRHQRFPPGSEVPAALQAVVRKAVALDPADRYPTADALATAIREARDTPSAGPGEATRELAHLQSGPLPQPPSAPRSGLPLARLLPVLLLIGGVLGYFASELTGSPAPKEIHWRVVGDALVVSYLAPGRKDVRLNVGQQLLAPDPVDPAAPGGPTERRRIVFRGLSATQETAARLVWDGGESPPYPAFADGPAVTGVAGAAKGGQVYLRAIRGCEAWWEDSPAVRFRLQKGKTPVPRPTTEIPEELVLQWEEQGLTFTRRWPRAAVLDALAEDLLGYGGVPEWRSIYIQRMENRRDTSGSNFVLEREPWRRSLPWLSAMLEADLPERRRAQLWENLVGWQVCLAAERLLGDDPPGLPLEPGRAGSLFVGEPRFPTWSQEAEYRPLDGSEARKENQPHRVLMIPRTAKDNPGFGSKSLDYATRVEITWPSLPTGPSPVHCLTIDMDRLKAATYMNVALRGGAEDGDLVYFHPGADLSRDPEKFRGHLTRCYPAAFSPPPGTKVQVTLDPVILAAFEFGGIRQVAMHVPKGE